MNSLSEASGKPSGTTAAAMSAGRFFAMAVSKIEESVSSEDDQEKLEKAIDEAYIWLSLQLRQEIL